MTPRRWLVVVLSLVAIAGCAKRQQNPQSVATRPNYGDIERDNDRLKVELDRLVAERDRFAEENAELRQLAKRRRVIFDHLRERLADLIDSKQLDLGFRRGLIVIQMPSDILFDAGSADLKKEGVKVVQTVAAAISTVEDRRFLIAGHTDNQLVLESKWKNNWRLSYARAEAVLKVILEEGYNPERLSAAGFSEYDPIADNMTEDGQARNRRTEIMVIPDLEKIFDALLGGQG